MSDRSPIRELNPHGKVIAINLERNVDILGMEIRTGRIVKARDFATSQHEATNSIMITRPAFKPSEGELRITRPRQFG